MNQFTKYNIVVEIYAAYDNLITMLYPPETPPDEVPTLLKRMSCQTYEADLAYVCDKYNLTERQLVYYENRARQIWHELNTL